MYHKIGIPFADVKDCKKLIGIRTSRKLTNILITKLTKKDCKKIMGIRTLSNLTID